MIVTDRPALMLNATWQPLCVVSVQRAIILILDGKAEMVEAGEGLIRSVSSSMPVPSVVRLVKFVRVPYKRTARLTHRAIMSRDDHECQYKHIGPCNGKAETIDHVIPRSRGGRHSFANTVASCKKHNSEKADHTLDELGWKLAHKPETPMSTHWVVIGVTRVEPAWKSYLTN